MGGIVPVASELALEFAGCRRQSPPELAGEQDHRDDEDPRVGFYRGVLCPSNQSPAFLELHAEGREGHEERHHQCLRQGDVGLRNVFIFGGDTGSPNKYWVSGGKSPRNGDRLPDEARPNQREGFKSR